MAYAIITFKDGSKKTGTVEKQEGQVFYIRIGQDVYKLVQGYQDIEIIEAPVFDDRISSFEDGTPKKWEVKMAAQAAAYWEKCFLKGLLLAWDKQSSWYTMKDLDGQAVRIGGMGRASDINKLLKTR